MKCDKILGFIREARKITDYYTLCLLPIHRHIIPLYVILNGEKRLRFTKLKFCELSVSEQAKPRSNSDDGISE